MRLLDSIAQQTVKPLEVIVSSSSCEPSDVPVLAEYPFPVTLILHRVRKNAAENRNIAKKLARGDIVSFFDADDIMLPRRLEAIRKAFIEGAHFVVHNYTNVGEECHADQAISIEHNVIVRTRSYCIAHKKEYYGQLYNENHVPPIRVELFPLHHSQSSITNKLNNTVQFREDAVFERREDAIFCADIANTGCPTAYIANKLSIYDISGRWE